MSPKNGCNDNKVSYFSLSKYIEKIKLNSNILNHLEETSQEFDKYITKLMKYDEETILYFLIVAFNEEIKDSNLIENHIIHPKKLNEKNLFFDSLTISHKRIKDLHKFVTEEENEKNYRKKDAWVRTLRKTEETIYWYGANPEDIYKFINDYIEIYKNKSLSSINNNPFIKSALVHLLIMRIHPFSDGNGRTSRIIQDMKFTELINKIYDYKLKISPLHISQSIYLNKQEYYKRLNSIYFDLNHDNNEEINKWFNFILNMFDEQIFYMQNNLEEKEYFLNRNEELFRNNKEEIKKLSKKINKK